MAVDFRPKEYSRVSRNEEQERSIEERWIEKKELCPRVYNGAKFRLHEALLKPPEMPVFKIGLTSYKEMVGTHYAQDRDALISSAKENGLGNPRQN